jgi:hypothetical protein
LKYVKEEDRVMIKEQFESLNQGKDDGIHKEFMLVSKHGQMEEVHLIFKSKFRRTTKR